MIVLAIWAVAAVAFVPLWAWVKSADRAAAEAERQDEIARALNRRSRYAAITKERQS